MSSADRYRQFFTEADADGSGYLTIQELVSILKAKGYKGCDEDIKVCGGAAAEGCNDEDFNGTVSMVVLIAAVVGTVMSIVKLV